MRLPFFFGAVVLCGTILLSPIQSHGEDDSMLRQRCYATGLMHGDDDTDPTVIGIPAGPCRESFDAGRAFFLKQQRQSDKALQGIDDQLRQTCLEWKERIANMEKDGHYKKEDVNRLRSMLAPDCRKFE